MHMKSTASISSQQWSKLRCMLFRHWQHTQHFFASNIQLRVHVITWVQISAANSQNSNPGLHGERLSSWKLCTMSPLCVMSSISSPVPGSRLQLACCSSEGQRMVTRGSQQHPGTYHSGRSTAPCCDRLHQICQGRSPIGSQLLLPDDIF